MYYCGIDIAKRKHAIAVVDEHGQPVQRPFTIENTRAGFDHLWQALADLEGPVLIGLEATGHYWWALYEDLMHHDHPVVVLNALQVHAFRKSGVRKVKSDRTDAGWIAEFLRFSQPAPAQPTTTVFLQLKDMSRFRYHLSDQICDCKRKLLSVLDRVFPEYETLFSSVFLSSSRQLLAKAASAQELATFDLSELTDLLQTASHNRFDHTKAEAVQTLARQSPASPSTSLAVYIELPSQAKRPTHRRAFHRVSPDPITGDLRTFRYQSSSSRNAWYVID